MLGNIGEKVGIAVLSAVILGALALLWQVLTDGGLIRALGGVTRAELERIAAMPSDPMPAGAVVAFDATGQCPEGWSPFAAGQSRAIVGASFGIDPEPGLGTNAAGRPLVAYKYRDHGGVEAFTLSAAQMPVHRHGVDDAYPSEVRSHIEYWVKPMPGGLSFVEVPGGVGSKGDIDKSGRVAIARRAETMPAGQGAPVDNMPPFIALFLCKKL